MYVDRFGRENILKQFPFQLQITHQSQEQILMLFTLSFYLGLLLTQIILRKTSLSNEFLDKHEPLRYSYVCLVLEYDLQAGN